MGKVLYKTGKASSNLGYWSAITDGVDSYLKLNFGSGMMTSSTYYKITKELFDEIDDNNAEDIISKGKILYRSSEGQWDGYLSKVYVDNWEEEFKKFSALEKEVHICLENMLRSQKKEYSFSSENQIAEIYDEIHHNSTYYYVNIMCFDEKQFYVFTYKFKNFPPYSYPIYKEEYENLMNSKKTKEDLESLRKKYQERFSYDNEYIYSEV